MSAMTADNTTVNGFVNNTLDRTSLEWLGKRYEGKVRDVYDRSEELVLVATDRQSAFDISWCAIPLKGQVLNQVSSWWFNRTKEVVPNHLIAVPDPNVSVTKKLKMFPVEVVVRAYLTGSTETSVWVNYDRGSRSFCGNLLPDGMKKNQRLPEIIITPTTKSHIDEPIDAHGVIDRRLASRDEWAQITRLAIALFAEGQRLSRERGLLLVDTKYEFGLDSEGIIRVGDELHTPDSSRYWVASSYEQRFSASQEPESLDKEFFRRWLVSEGFDPKSAATSPRPIITDEIRAMLAIKYIELFERITGEQFVYPRPEPITDRIESNLHRYFGKKS